MSRSINVTINGSAEPLNVELGKKIQIAWETSNVFRTMELTVFDDSNRLVYQHSVEEALRSTHSFSLANHPDRRKYTYLLRLIEGEEERTISGYFYSKNQHFHDAAWITRLDNPLEKEQHFFREKNNCRLTKLFTVEKTVSRSIVDCCGLGYGVLFVNGKRVTEARLVPDVSNYDRVVYYNSYDITELLTVGQNRIDFWLGNGWYIPAPAAILGKYNVRKQLAIGKNCLKLLLETEYADGERSEIVSDETWQCGNGPFLYNDIYIGEVYTDTVEEQALSQAVAIHGPTGQLVPSFIPEIKRAAKVSARKISETATTTLYDFGEIMTGQVQMTLSANYIGEVTILYAEDMKENKLDFSSTTSGRYGITDEMISIHSDDPILQKDVVVKKQAKQLHYQNEFTYHSFRYAEVSFSGENPVEILEGRTIHTEIEQKADFESSSYLLNQLWEAGNKTRLNNIHSYFEDCTRERFGYGGDIVALLHTHVVTFEVEQLLKKVLLDFANDQRADGGITQTAPYMGIMTNGPSNGGGALGWQLVFPTLGNTLLEQYGAFEWVSTLQKKFAHHLSYLLSFSSDYISSCCLGDWGSVDESVENGQIHSPDQPFCSACMYLILLKEYVTLFTHFEGQEELLVRLKKRIVEVEKGIMDRFYHDGHFGEGSQSSFIFAVKAGLLPEEQQYLIDQLVQKIEKRADTFSFGLFGMSWAYQLLPKFGYGHTVFNWLVKTEYPSYGAMLETGNQTLSEHFPVGGGEAASYAGGKNHAMFASYGAWMINGLVGITECSANPYCISIDPQYESALTFVQGSLKTKSGVVHVAWERKAGGIHLQVVAPDRLLVEVQPKTGYEVKDITNQVSEGERKICCFLIESSDVK